MEKAKNKYGYEHVLMEESLLRDSGEQVRIYRRAKSMSQSDLGGLLGVRKAQVSKIESGGNHNIESLDAAFTAMGLKATVRVQPDIDRDVMKLMVSDLVECIDEYARVNHISVQEAFFRLDLEGKIDSYILNYNLDKGSLI